MSIRRTCAIAAAAALVCDAAARAGIQSLEDIPFNGIFTEDSNPDDIAIGEAQFSMSIFDLGAGLASFVFDNTGPDNAAISGIYFDGGILLAIDMIVNGPGVMFSEGGNPMDLPGGNKVGFMADLHGTADPPPPVNGVNPGESIEFQISYAGTFGQLVDAILLADLRVGLHGIGIGVLKEGSESFVNKPVPGPGALGLLGLAALRRRRRW